MEAERRQVTVLFADMVGFTSFSERSGEEAAYKLMRSLSKLMDEAVREQGGALSTGPQRYERGTCSWQIKHDRAGVEPGVFSGGGRPAAIVIDRGTAEAHAGGGIERRPR